MPFLDAIMDIADVDGRLTRAEHERWIKALMNVAAKDAETTARCLDANGDGSSSRHRPT
ncbi:hypothetical protein AB4305_07795 [Nocardia sp. 2YAB30]|uniref:hypothetical protein n=1 Tax=unclassified Nocardia TaxID=2637762 RepID=UPI003F9C0E29